MHRALPALEKCEDDVGELEETTNLRKLARAAHEFAAYTGSDIAKLINCGERYRAGERISFSLAESTVNAAVSKRFPERQQMQWMSSCQSAGSSSTPTLGTSLAGAWSCTTTAAS